MQRFCIPLHLLYGFRFIGFNGRGWLGSRAILLMARFSGHPLVVLPHYFLNQFQAGFSIITFNGFAFKPHFLV